MYIRRGTITAQDLVAKYSAHASASCDAAVCD
jgi:hypothetical protein